MFSCLSICDCKHQYAQRRLSIYKESVIALIFRQTQNSWSPIQQERTRPTGENLGGMRISSIFLEPAKRFTVQISNQLGWEARMPAQLRLIRTAMKVKFIY